jgi:hypothetical protein
MMKRSLRSTLILLWPAIVLEGLIYLLGDRGRPTDDGTWLFVFVAGFAPTFVAGFRLAKAPSFPRTALLSGASFWIGASLFWTIIAAMRGPSAPSDESTSAVVGGYVLATTMLLPVAAVVAFVAGIVARYAGAQQQKSSAPDDGR